MKNLIVIVATHGVLKNDWAVRSVKSILNYADGIGVSCEIHTEQSGFVQPIGVSQVPEAFEKFDVLGRSDFDTIVTLDCDLLIRKDAPSIFDEFNKSELAALDESNVVNIGSWTAQLWDANSRYLTNISFPKNNNDIWRYSNTGVVLSTKAARQKLLRQNQSMRWLERRKIGFNTDQSYLSILAHMSGIEVDDIGSEWNSLVPILGTEHTEGSNILHFAGKSKESLLTIGARGEFW